MSNKFFKSMDDSKGFEANFDLLMKGIDKSKNHLKTITDSTGHTRKVWVSNEGTETTDAGRNAGKQYEKTGKRHTSHSGFDSGDEVSFTAGGKTITGTFRHVNENKHGAMAVIRGADGKLYERAVSKISKAKGGDPETRNKIRDMMKKETPATKSDPNTTKYMSKFTAEEHRQKAEHHTKKAAEITGGHQKDKDAKKAHLAIAASHKQHADEMEKKSTPAAKPVKDGKEDKMKKVAEIKKKADLDHDLTLLKKEYAKVATKDEYNPTFDEKNIGDASALEVIVRQYKHKLGQKGVDISKLGLKYHAKQLSTGKNTSEMPEA